MRQKLKRALSVLSAAAMVVAAIPATEISIFAADTTKSMALSRDIDNVIQHDESVLANDCLDDSEIQEIFTQADDVQSL